jgi:membrane-bound metal-dependent hydrolase YbcI (DUF457 family)
MDPVSHVAFGRTLIALDGDRRLGPGGIAACLVGSLIPDVDAVFMPSGWDVYLVHHQGGTHSLIGSIACAVVAAALVKARVAGRFGSLLLAAWAGTAGHVLLDLISGADVRVLWPFGPRAAVPLFAMADPWLGGVLVLGVLWLVLGRARARHAAGIVLIVVIGISAAKAMLYVRTRYVADAQDPSAQMRRAEVEWGSLTRWLVYAAGPDSVNARRVDPLTGTVTPLMDVARNVHDPLVERSLQFDTVQNFLAAHDVTFAVVTGDRSTQQVLWSDLRYCGEPERHVPPWAPTSAGGSSPVSCGLWFGGEFEPGTGAPRAAIVHVGHIVQRRPVRHPNATH